MTPLRLVRMSARLGVVLSLLFAGAAAADTPRPQIDPAAPDLYEMRFPVDGPHSFTDSFGAPREGKRVHQGIDIFAEKLTPVVAVADGVVRKTATGSTAGRYIVVEHDDGWLSYYLHLNNDSPGTDDGRRAQPVAGIVPGAVVKAGDLLDYVGDSGNAESTPSHLHFELHRRNGDIVNPYPHLLAAAGASETAVERALQEAGDDILASESTVVVGHFDPGDGFAAGIWVNDDTVYLGTWGRPGACP